jgi:hypothetical protein
MSPNGGSIYKKRDGSVTVKWFGTPRITSADISYEKDGHINTLANGVPSKTAGMSSYTWANAPIGDGYKIVVTGDINSGGSDAEVDSSDFPFSIKANPGVDCVDDNGQLSCQVQASNEGSPSWWQTLFQAGNNGQASPTGQVQGAATSIDEELDAALSDLANTLVEFKTIL